MPIFKQRDLSLFVASDVNNVSVITSGSDPNSVYVTREFFFKKVLHHCIKRQGFETREERVFSSLSQNEAKAHLYQRKNYSITFLLIFFPKTRPCPRC